MQRLSVFLGARPTDPAAATLRHIASRNLDVHSVVAHIARNEQGEWRGRRFHQNRACQAPGRRDAHVRDGGRTAMAAWRIGRRHGIA